MVVLVQVAVREQWAVLKIWRWTMVLVAKHRERSILRTGLYQVLSTIWKALQTVPRLRASDQITRADAEDDIFRPWVENATRKGTVVAVPVGKFSGCWVVHGLSEKPCSTSSSQSVLLERAIQHLGPPTEI